MCATSRGEPPPGWRSALERMGQLGPRGGIRCIPVDEYLEARRRGDQEVEREFFRALRLHNGVYKTTYPHRMDELLPLLIEAAGAMAARPLRVLDVGCSSGISTVEMHQAFAAEGIACLTWGTDLMLFPSLVRRADGCSMLFDKEERVLQIDVGRWATPWTLRLRDRVWRPRTFGRAHRLLNREVGRFRAALHEPLAGYVVARVPLLSSAATAPTGLQFVEEDLLRPQLTGSFDLIRAANLLNLDYFSPDVLRAMVAALSVRLTEGGRLLISRVETGQFSNRATLFRWSGGRLTVERRIHGGSEITELVL